MIEPPCTDRYARWCEMTANQLMVSFLLDCGCNKGSSELIRGHQFSMIRCFGE